MGPHIPENVAREVLDFFGDDAGYPAGSFFSAVMLAFSRADGHNFALLYASFPEYGEAMRTAMTESLDDLRDIAGATQR